MTIDLSPFASQGQIIYVAFRVDNSGTSPLANYDMLLDNVRVGPATSTNAKITAVAPPVYVQNAGSQPVIVNVSNIGTNPIAAGYTINWNVDGGTSTAYTSTPAIAVGASANVSLGNATLSAGQHTINATMVLSGDVDPSDNTIASPVAVNVATDAIVEDIWPRGSAINTGVQQVYVNIYNQGSTTMSNFSIDWWINDDPTTKHTWTEPTITIAPGEEKNINVGSFNFSDPTQRYKIDARLASAGNLTQSNNSKTVYYNASSTFEDFNEPLGTLPNGWTKEITGPGTPPAQGGFIDNGSPFDNNPANHYIYAEIDYVGARVYTWSPLLNLTAGDKIIVKAHAQATLTHLPPAPGAGKVAFRSGAGQTITEINSATFAQPETYVYTVTVPSGVTGLNQIGLVSGDPGWILPGGSGYGGALNGAGAIPPIFNWDDFSIEANIAYPIIPANLNITNPQPTSATANWNASPNATSYSVQYRRVGTTTWSGPITVSAPTVTANLTGLSQASFYEVQVNASNASGTSEFSGSVIFKTGGTGVSAPIVGYTIQPTCTGLSAGSVTLTGLPATGTWTINKNDGSNTTPAGTGSGATYTVTGLTMGAYTFTVTTSAGTSTPSASVTIGQAKLSQVTFRQIIQPACGGNSTGSFLLTGLPLTGTWTLNPGNIQGTGFYYQVTGAAPNPTGYQYTVSQGSCISDPSQPIIINALPNTPSAPTASSVVQASCSSNGGSVTFNNLPIVDGTTGRSITRVEDGETFTFSANGNGTETWPKQPNGTYTYVVSVNGCAGPASAPITFSPQTGVTLPPIVGTITQPGCSDNKGTVVLSGLTTGDVIYGVYDYSVSATGPTMTVTVAIGQQEIYIYRAGCKSPPVLVTINKPVSTAPGVPRLGTPVNATCQVSTGSIAVDSLPENAVTWIIKNQNNVQLATGTGPATIINGINPGTYTLTVSIGNCPSPATPSFTIAAASPAPGIPSPGTPSGNTVVVNGLPSAGTWALYKTLTSVTPNVTTEVATGTGTSYTVTGLDPGTYTFKVANNNFCISGNSTPVTIGASGLTLNLTAAIQGYLNTTTNRMNMTDKIKVILRANVAPAYAALDSAIVNLDSASLGATMTFHPASTAASYYIVVKHRNSIETWSNPVTFTSTSLSYNFTDAATEAYGNNLIQKGTKFCIYGADVNQDRTIDLKDASPIQNAINNYLAGYLLPTDVTGDHLVDLKDSSVEFNNQSNYVHAQCPICN
jgi:hypothetical protein